MNGDVHPFPVYNFPRVYCPLYGQQRELFADYGSTAGVTVDESSRNDGVEFVRQKSRRSQIWESLQASGPSLPLLDYHHYCGEQSEPCMSALVERKRSLQRALNTLKACKGKIKQQRERKKLEKLFSMLELSTATCGKTGAGTCMDVGELDEDEPPPSDSDISVFESPNDHRKRTRASRRPMGQAAIMSEIKRLCPMDFKQFLRESQGVFTDSYYNVACTSAYCGGCLSQEPLSDQHGLLFYPRGDKLNKLRSGKNMLTVGPTITLAPRAARQGYQRLRDISTYSIAKHHLSVDKTPAFHQELTSPIYQTTTRLLHDQVYIGVREKDQVSVMNYNPDEQESSLCVTHFLPNDETPTFIDISPYVPGEAVVAGTLGSYGSVYSITADTRLVPVLSDLAPRFDQTDTWWQCYHGSHPRQIVVSNLTGASIYDIRGYNKTCVGLFELPHVSLHHSERLLVAKQHPVHDMLHVVATDYSINLVDARFPNNTVLQWSHSLLSCPQYLDIVCGVTSDYMYDACGVSGDGADSCGVSGDLVLLGGQAPPEIHVFPVDIDDRGRHPPCGAATPWHVAQTDDFAWLVNRKEPVVTSDFIQNHLTRPLTGMCGVAHPHSQEGGVSILQLTSTGDLFCQDYSFTGERTDKTWSTGPGSGDLCLDPETWNKASDWLKQAAENVKESLSVHNQDAVHVTLKMSYLLSEQMVPHVSCPLCSSLLSHQVAVTTHQVAAQHGKEPLMCYRCNRSVRSTEELKHAVKQDEIYAPADGETRLPDALTRLNLSPGAHNVTSDIILALWDRQEVDDLIKKRDVEVKAKLSADFAKWKHKKEGEGHSDDEALSDDNELESAEMLVASTDPPQATPDSPYSLNISDQPYPSGRTDPKLQSSRSESEEGLSDIASPDHIPGSWSKVIPERVSSSSSSESSRNSDESSSSSPSAIVIHGEKLDANEISPAVNGSSRPKKLALKSKKSRQYTQTESETETLGNVFKVPEIPADVRLIAGSDSEMSEIAVVGESRSTPSGGIFSMITPPRRRHLSSSSSVHSIASSKSSRSSKSSIGFAVTPPKLKEMKPDKRKRDSVGEISVVVSPEVLERASTLLMSQEPVNSLPQRKPPKKKTRVLGAIGFL